MSNETEAGHLSNKEEVVDEREEEEEDELEEEEKQEDFQLEKISADYYLESPEPSLNYTHPYDIRCLGEIQLSRSSLLTNPYYLFPELKIDFDLSENLWREEYPVQYSDQGIDRYIDLVKKYRTWTVRSFIDQLPTRKVDLKYYPLSNQNFRAIFEVLSYNKNVRYVDVTNKVIQADEEIKALCEFLTKNRIVEILILRHCRIGPEKMLKVAECLRLNVTLMELDLSYCDIQDVAIGHLLDAIMSCESLISLDLAFNNITANSGQHFANFLSDNKYLERLDVNGNFINEPGLKLLANSFKENTNKKLVYLNLSNNSITDLASKSIRILCLYCNGLEDLNLSRNLLSGSTMKVIASCLPITKLKKLNLGYNPISTEDLSLLIQSMANLQMKDSFQYLDLTDKYVHSQEKVTVEEIRKSGRTIVFNDYLCDFIIKGPDVKMMLLNRLKAIAETGRQKKKGKRQSSFGSFFYEITQDLIKNQQFPHFIALTKNKKIIKDINLQNRIMKEFKHDKSNKINVGLMRDMYLKAYPDTPRPPPPKALPPTPPTPSPPEAKINKKEKKSKGKVKKSQQETNKEKKK